MSSNYIETHFSEIREHNSVIEKRMGDDVYTIDSLKLDNKKCVDGFQRVGEKVVLINSNHKQTINAIFELIN